MFMKCMYFLEVGNTAIFVNYNLELELLLSFTYVSTYIFLSNMLKDQYLVESILIRISIPLHSPCRGSEYLIQNILGQESLRF